MKSVPVLHTHRCTLSAVTQSDIHILRQILDDTETQRFLPELCEEFQTAKSLQQFVASFDKYLLQDDGVLWGVRKDSVFIGFIAIIEIKTNPTLFYAMHPVYRNKGYMKECLIETIDYMHDTNLCDMLHTEVCNENLISCQMLEDLCFQVIDANTQKKFYGQKISTSNSY